MDRIRNLNRYQKGVLLFLVVMAVIFTGFYSVITFRTGYLYNGHILVPETENGNTLYRAEVQGEEWCFTVMPDRTVTFRCGKKLYGPYSAQEDPTAIPMDHDFAEYMTGVEVRSGDEVLFRGGIMEFGEYSEGHRNWLMYNEDGTSFGFQVYAVMSDGTTVSGDGQVIDPMEPSVSDVLRMMEGPELTHKGEWYGWLAGILVSVIAAVSILFADELFRWSLVFQVRNVDQVEPSDWEIAGRYVAWTAFAVMALVIYCMGLQ